MLQKNNKPMVLHKHNVMVKAKYNLTTLETKLYLNILYFLQSKLNDENFEMRESNSSILLSIPKCSFQDLIPGKQYLEDAKFIRMFEGLRTKPIYYKVNKKWTLSGFIDRAIINEDDSNMLSIEMDKFTISMLSDYKDNGYTPLNLALMFGLEGMYSYRLYELIRLWSNTKDVITYTIEELKEFLMLEDKKSYNTYANFKNKVIIPAVDELNNMGLFYIEYTENKIGRKINSIDFKVKDLDKRKYFNKSSIIDKGIIEVDDIVEQEVEGNTNEKNCIDKHKEFFVPNRKLFIPKTLENFKNDFKNIDFKDDTYKKLLQESISITLDRDDEGTLEVKSYNFFKKTLENKINSLSKKKVIPTVKTRFHNINQTFNKYSPDELEKILLESQKDKFK